MRPSSRLAALVTTILALTATAAAFAPPAHAARTLVIDGATLIDGTGAAPALDAVVVVRDGRIVAAGPRDTVRVPKVAERIEGFGRWVTPGLVDAHIHFFQSGGAYTRPDIVDLRAVRPYEDESRRLRERIPETLRRYLASGVTAVVDMGGPMWNFDVRREARRSSIAPRVAVAGPLISTVSRPQLDAGDPPIIRAEDPDHARRLARDQLQRKPDLLKVWFIVTDGRPFADAVDVVRAVVDEAHREGVRVAVHATQLASARACVEAGADILVHSVDDEPVDDAFLALLQAHGTLYIPTLAVYEGYAEVLGGAPVLTDIEQRLGAPEAVASWHALAALEGESEDPARRARAEERCRRMRARIPVMQANLRRVHAAGIPVAAGPDAGNIGSLHGPVLHRELEMMQEAGLAPLDVLVAATRDAAGVFAAEPHFGTIEVGKRADLLILDGDPLADLSNLRRVHRLVLDGRVLDPDDLVAPSPATVVDRQLHAYNQRDLDAFVEVFAEDVVMGRLPSGETTEQGREAFRRIYEEVFAQSPDLHCTITNRVIHGDWVIDHELVVGLRGRGPVRGVAVYRVEDGLIREVRFLPSVPE